MSFSIKEFIGSHINEGYDLHKKYINPQFVKVLKTIGFDIDYVKGEGLFLYDKKGNRYLDFLSGYGVFTLGRGHPKVIAALKEALDMNYANLVQLDCSLYSGLLAQELIKRCPSSIDTVFFTNSGTEAVESAIKFARCYTKRDSIVYCNKSFHGLTMGSLSVNGDNNFTDGFGKLLTGMINIPFNDLESLEKALRLNKVAAFIVEPIQGKGVNIPDSSYFTGVRHLCNKYGVLLVIDEVQTGLGRTGKFFAYEHWNIKPDIITISKALSGGYIPVGAVLYTRDIYNKVFSRMDRSVVHSSTFGGNVMAMVAALVTLKLTDDEGLIKNAYNMGKLFLEELSPLVSKHELVTDIRGMGLMLAIEFGNPRSLKMKTAWRFIEGAGSGIFSQMVVMPLFKGHNILTQVAGHKINVIKLLPPLVITKEEVSYFAMALDDVLSKCHRFPGALWDFATTLMKHYIRDNKS